MYLYSTEYNEVNMNHWNVQKYICHKMVLTVFTFHAQDLTKDSGYTLCSVSKNDWKSVFSSTMSFFLNY